MSSCPWNTDGGGVRWLEDSMKQVEEEFGVSFVGDDETGGVG